MAMYIPNLKCLIARNGAFLILLACLVLTQSGRAQESTGRFQASVIAGVSTSQISGDNLAGFNKVGIYGGVGVQTRINDRWRAGLDISFIQKGSRENAQPDKGDFESYLMALNYAEVPLYGVYVQDKFEFDIGILPAFLISSREEDQNGTVVRPVDRDFEPLDLSGMLGLSYPLGDKVRLNIRASQSLIAARKHAGGSVFRLNRGQYNSVLSFAIRWKIGQ